MTNPAPGRPRGPRRRGVTLVEVLAGLALLGTLVAGLLVADAAQGRQARRAEDRLAAVAALDELLEGWDAGGPALPPAPSGPLGTGGRLAWSARRVRRAGADRLGCVVVRVEARPAGAADARPLAAVELLVEDAVGGRR